MEIRPRQLLLEIWEAAAGYSYQSGEWRFGGLAESNSISDAEQLLCLIYPFYRMPGMAIENPDKTAKDVCAALERIGDARQIPQFFMRALGEYLDRYTSERGSSVFSGGSYFQADREGAALTPEQRALDVVESFSISITLSLAILGFVRELRPTIRQDALLVEMRKLEENASRRLTASMVGILRCFTVRTFAAHSEEGRALCDLVSPEGKTAEKALGELSDALVPARACLRELKLGVDTATDVTDDSLLFECGWSWGVIRESPLIDLEPNALVDQAQGVALAKPSLYFTAVALDGIADLLSERTRLLGLINPDQQGLVGALQLRFNLAQLYWSTIARLGRTRWPVEEVPWHSTSTAEEGLESEYNSLLAASITIEALSVERTRDVDIARIAYVLAELAVRGRVTRRARLREPAIELHLPGVRLTLAGAEDFGPPVVWPVADFSTALLKCVARATAITRDSALRDMLIVLADQIWDCHVRRRQILDGPGAGLWDDISLFGLSPMEKRPSWYFTKRVTEALVAVAAVSNTRPYSARLAELALDMLAEADHLYTDRMLREPPTSTAPECDQLHGIGTNLRRARELRERQPATSIAIVQAALRDLDMLARARRG